MIGKLVSLACQSAVSIFVDPLAATRRAYAHKARSAVRDSYFQARAKIKPITVQDFCALFAGKSPELTVLPPFLENSSVGSPQYFLSLAAICAARKPRTVVEFGTYLGASALVFGVNTDPDARIVTIDLPDDLLEADTAGLDKVDTQHVVASRNKVGSWYRGQPASAKISEIKCDSRKLRLADRVPSADLVFIDGGHNYDCIAADTTNAFSIVSAKGIVLWDDYFWLYPDVIRYLDELSSLRTLYRLESTNLVGYIHLP